MLSINAKWYHRLFSCLMPERDREDCMFYAVFGLFSIVALILGAVFFIAGLASGQTNLAEGPTIAFGLYIMFAGAFTLSVLESAYRLGKVERVEGYDAKNAIRIYNRLSVANKVLASGLVRNICKAETYADSQNYIDKRMVLLRQIEQKDIDEQRAFLSSDDSDVEAVKSILETHQIFKSLT